MQRIDKVTHNVTVYTRLQEFLRSGADLAVLGHQLLVLLPQSVHPVDHLLHELNLESTMRPTDGKHRALLLPSV